MAFDFNGTLIGLVSFLKEVILFFGVFSVLVSINWKTLGEPARPFRMSSVPPKRIREDENSPPKCLNMPGDICKHCNKKCTLKGKSSEAIQCDICFVWVHAACEGLTKEQYKAFSDFSKSCPNIAYCCKLNGCFTRLNQVS